MALFFKLTIYDHIFYLFSFRPLTLTHGFLFSLETESQNKHTERRTQPNLFMFNNKLTTYFFYGISAYTNMRMDTHTQTLAHNVHNISHSVYNQLITTLVSISNILDKQVKLCLWIH